ncbi:2-keto-4-pentenoate hydratase [Castellaniella defragrans]|uniref:2-keto-4-pentenoate hydratase n=1 Tax=Castellaniella defragrans TaxID=75697 RepID=A0A7W9WP92_CASDE|nr:2-keto-4-pentenoate hydratase [Castellaniella defragrans]
MPAGTLILTGGLTEAVAVQPGDHVALHAQGMGCTSLTFV